MQRVDRQLPGHHFHALVVEQGGIIDQRPNFGLGVEHGIFGLHGGQFMPMHLGFGPGQQAGGDVHRGPAVHFLQDFSGLVGKTALLQ